MLGDYVMIAIFLFILLSGLTVLSRYFLKPAYGILKVLLSVMTFIIKLPFILVYKIGVRLFRGKLEVVGTRTLSHTIKRKFVTKEGRVRFFNDTIKMTAPLMGRRKRGSKSRHNNHSTLKNSKNF